MGIGHVVGGGCRWIRFHEHNTPGEDRVTWRHNCVLAVISKHLTKWLRVVNTLAIGVPEQCFVAEGQARPLSSCEKHDVGLLNDGRDWELLIDLPESIGQTCQNWDGSHLHLPSDVCPSRHIPDLCFVSRSSKVLLLGPELTCPMEENISNWHSTKANKYSSLTEHGNPEWQFHHIPPIEVGAFGFVPPSFRAAMKSIGMPNNRIKSLVEEASHTARKCSYVLWCLRDVRDFVPFRYVSPSDNDLSHLEAI